MNDISPADTLNDPGEIRVFLTSPELCQPIQTTRTWIMTLGILASCWGGLAVVVVLVSLSMSGFYFTSSDLHGLLILMFTGLFCLLPLVLMFQFCARAKRFLISGSEVDFFRLLRTERWMWHALGALGVFVLLLNLIMLVTFALGISL